MGAASGPVSGDGGPGPISGDGGPDAVSADGSPVAVYLAAPPDDCAEVVAQLAPSPARLLELGCGVGRTTRQLVGLGYRVTAVDDSPQMLAHVTGCEVVEADLFALDLGARFDVVLGASHFVDDADPARRSALLATCARHLAPGGVVLLERYDPAWVAAPESYGGSAGPVAIDFDVLDVGADGVVQARLVYDLRGRTWVQEFAFVAATEQLVGREAQAHGLALVGVHGDDATWLALRRQ